eukprot:scaffold1260_cov343-Prasinococcus_capsulatus_cf.AAC.2
MNSTRSWEKSGSNRRAWELHGGERTGFTRRARGLLHAAQIAVHAIDGRSVHLWQDPRQTHALRYATGGARSAFLPRRNYSPGCAHDAPF